MEVIVEEGAVMSEDDETPNRKTHGWIEALTPCPLWDQDAPVTWRVGCCERSLRCMLLNGDRLRQGEANKGKLPSQCVAHWIKGDVLTCLDMF